MILRKWEKKDLQNIAKLHQDNFIDCWNYNMLQESFNNGNYLTVLAEDNGKIIGTLTYFVTDTEADLISIVVDSNYRNRGVATYLMQNFNTVYQNFKVQKIFLEVRKQNLFAQKLYLKFGYKKIAERKKYYFDGEDAVIMVWEEQN